MYARYLDQLPPTTNEMSVPRTPLVLATCSCTLVFGLFSRMSMSSTHRLSGLSAAVALRTSTGSPVLCLLQMSAILAPSPNLPRVCRTPYLEPASTRPRLSGIELCGMPQPLSRTITL